jgi:uracil-DNA glycosylase family 4
VNLPVFPSHPDCRACGRWEQTPRNPGVPTTRWGLPGPDAPVLVCIGPAPGYHEHTHNEPFVGKPGRLLRDILLAELSTLCTIYGTYLVRCGPEPDAKARDYKSCHPHWSSDLAAILAAHPCSQIHMLLLGADAATQFHRLLLSTRCSHKDAMARNGKPVTTLGRELLVFSTLHPAAILRNNSLIHTVEDHIELLISTVRGCAPIPTDPDIQPPRSPHHQP